MKDYNTIGQLISKGLFATLNSSKKPKRNQLYYYDISGWIVFVHFLEEFKTPKRHFEINWPLANCQENKKKCNVLPLGTKSILYWEIDLFFELIQ